MPKRAAPETAFARALVLWQRRHGRHALPWQASRDPYRIWLAEIMLQQTRVDTVIPYYERFLARFPDLRTLADAQEEEVLGLWAGLGYYARARNLHAAARVLGTRHGGRFPQTPAALAELPGIGRSTAAAIAVFAFGARAAILDGNVKRVLARRFGIEGFPGMRAVEQKLWRLAEELLPARAIGTYTQALMDLGATVCLRRQPRCELCPVARACTARREGRTLELPQARPRQAIPLRHANWLVLHAAGRVLLERRPPQGIWGGLWAFPEFGRGAAASYCRIEFGCDIAPPRRLAAIEHAFTHFRLRAVPVLCAVRSVAPHAGAPGRRWLDMREAAGAATPAPVRRLLEQLMRAAPAARR